MPRDPSLTTPVIWCSHPPPPPCSSSVRSLHLKGSSKARVVRPGQRLPKAGEGMPNGVFWHRQQGLLQVLKAYTLYRPEQGYCQAQGPVAAVLLMHLPPEVSALDPAPALGTQDPDPATPLTLSPTQGTLNSCTWDP